MASSTSITGLFSRLSLLSRNTTAAATMTTPRLFSTTSSSLARKAPTPAASPAKTARRNRSAPKSEN
ncbi:ring finger domain-containing, partial [Trichoderma arundinaceum]